MKTRKQGLRPRAPAKGPQALWTPYTEDGGSRKASSVFCIKGSKGARPLGGVRGRAPGFDL